MVQYEIGSTDEFISKEFKFSKTKAASEYFS